MSWFIWTIILGGLFIALNAFSPSVRGITFSSLRLCWSGISWLGRRIGVPAILVLIGIFALIFTFFLLFFWVGYQTNSNAILQPLIIFNLVMLLLTATLFKSTRLALLFMFLCNITLFAHADVIIFKTHINEIAAFTLFCLFFVAAGVYFEKVTKFPGTFMTIIFVATFLFDGYTHLDKDRWEAVRDNYLVKRTINTANLEAESGVLTNDWKFALIKMRPEYELLVVDDVGNFVTEPKFSVKPGAKILVYAKQNPATPQAVKDVFLNFPVSLIKSSDFRIKEQYWVLSENIELLTDLNTNGPKVIKTINIDLGPNEEMEVPEVEVGRSIMVVNSSSFTLNAVWGTWNYEFKPGQKVYNFTTYKPGDKFMLKNFNYIRVGGVTAYIMEGEKVI